jgi:hypothetical protein
MDRKDYDDKVQQMLNDQRTYKVLDKDPTQRTEKKLNEKLANLKGENKISDSLYKRLCSSDGLPPRFYGLPKIHKPGFPLRPIVSFIDSPTYMLSKHLAQILSPMMGKTDFTVKNSVEFCEQMKNVSLKEDEELVPLTLSLCSHLFLWNSPFKLLKICFPMMTPCRIEPPFLSMTLWTC